MAIPAVDEKLESYQEYCQKVAEDPHYNERYIVVLPNGTRVKADALDWYPDATVIQDVQKDDGTR